KSEVFRLSPTSADLLLTPFSSVSVLPPDEIPHVVCLPFFHSVTRFAYVNHTTGARELDLILHVQDISSRGLKRQNEVTEKVLDRLNLSSELKKNMITVWNKIDLVSEEMQKTLPNRPLNCAVVSCRTNEGMAQLRSVIEQRLLYSLGYLSKTFRVPMGGPQLSYLYRTAAVKNVVPAMDGNHLKVTTLLPNHIYEIFLHKFGDLEISG
ncbi:unnamed protein product, partial [Soboliphyme baturini]|uniref:Hflx-type G domain-containing protein n=1 Tax=Soboliphyme baturini TaxID=241478 RepID=A0A183IKG2_9BILA